MSTTSKGKTNKPVYLTKKSRQANLDIIRIIALVFVFMIHGVEVVWDISPNGMSSVSIVTRIVVLTIYSIGRLSVPLFLFITGYLMLDKYYKPEEIWDFYKTKVWRLLRATWLWIGIYYLLDIFFMGRQFSPFDCIEQFLFLSDWFVAPHLWYMPVIIGLYLFIPFISNALQKIDKRVISLMLFIGVMYLFIVPTVNNIATAYDLSPVVNKMGLYHLGGFCGFMMVIGQLVRRHKRFIEQHIKTWMVAIGLVLALYFSITLHYLMICNLGEKYNPWYDSIFILIAAISLFIILLRTFDGVKENSILTRVSTSVFGCYLVHYIFLYYCIIRYDSSGSENWFIYTMLVLGSVTFSILFIFLIRSISRKMANALGFNM